MEAREWIIVSVFGALLLVVVAVMFMLERPPRRHRRVRRCCRVGEKRIDEWHPSER